MKPPRTLSRPSKVELTNTCVSPDDQIIDLDTAIDYFHGHFATNKCRSYSNNYGFGSYFHIEGTRFEADLKKRTNAGVLLYKCLDNSVRRDGFFALRLEDICIPSDDDEFTLEDNHSLTPSSLKIRYTAPSIRTKGQIADFLSQLEIEQRYLRVDREPLTGADIRPYHNEYKKFFQYHPAYCDLGLGFFLMDHWNAFIEQTPPPGKTIVGFCAFHGFDPCIDEEQVRIVMIAVDSDGHLVIGGGAVLLEKSWPPKSPHCR